MAGLRLYGILLQIAIIACMACPIGAVPCHVGLLGIKPYFIKQIEKGNCENARFIFEEVLDSCENTDSLEAVKRLKAITERDTCSMYQSTRYSGCKNALYCLYTHQAGNWKILECNNENLANRNFVKSCLNSTVTEGCQYSVKLLQMLTRAKEQACSRHNDESAQNYQAAEVKQPKEDRLSMDNSSPSEASQSAEDNQQSEDSQSTGGSQQSENSQSPESSQAFEDSQLARGN